MKRTAINRRSAPRRSGKLRAAGKRARLWNNERRRQQKVCDRLGITACEIRLPGCTFRHELTMAHARKRRKCVKEGLDLVVRACWACHQKLEATPPEVMERVVLQIREHRGEEYFERLGADSIDGTGLARYSWMREAIYEAVRRPGLFDRQGEAAA